MGTQNDISWELAFRNLPITEHISRAGFYDVSAEDLKKAAGGREPRHLAKIDHESNRPKVFRDNGLNILAITNSDYRIGTFNPFVKLPELDESSSKIRKMEPPTHLETLTARVISSENAVVYTAYSSKMIDDFCEDQVVPTVSGRMRTEKFKFSMDTYDGKQQLISVDGAQIEIDAGFEGSENFYLFEVKNSLSSDFNLRQVYYPFATWKNRLNKDVKNVFLTHSNDIFNFYEISFEIDEVATPQILKHSRYSLGDIAPKISQFEEAIRELANVKLVNVPFPQADKFERVVDLVSLLIETPRTKEQLTENFDFDPRQSDYYLNAAKYLGLAQGTETTMFAPTMLGTKIFSVHPREKNAFLMAILLKVPGIKELYNVWIKSGVKPDLDEAIRVLENYPEVMKYADSTKKRRAQTILSWAQWVVNQSELASS